MTSSPLADPARTQALLQWLQGLAETHQLLPESLSPANEDASTRRYLRVRQHSGSSLVVMDAPPQTNAMAPFLQVDAMLREAGLHAPEILAHDEAQGFMLLEDLGDMPYVQALPQASAREADGLMRSAIDALVRWQSSADAGRLPVYDEAFVRRELQIFVDWCVQRHHGRQWDETQQRWWAHCCEVLVRNVQEQPQLAMHRDYMARNLMVCEPNPGILDFQDAVRGPIAYDMISLLRDSHLSWDEERELDWAIRYWEQARRAGLPVGEDFGELWKRMELCGVQRHLKILGLFCRLHHRDGKSAYLAELPRFFAYAIKVSTRYIELSPLTHLLQDLQGDLVQTGFSLR